MRLSAVPGKLVELSAFPIKDVKARRLFILADGKRTLGQLFSMCNIEAEEGVALVKLMIDDGHLHLPDDDYPSDIDLPVAPQITAGDQHLVPVVDFIDGLTAELAKYIGPVASIVMGDFDLPAEAIGIKERRRIINAVLEEIDGEKLKKRFSITVQAAEWNRAGN